MLCLFEICFIDVIKESLLEATDALKESIVKNHDNLKKYVERLKVVRVEKLNRPAFVYGKSKYLYFTVLS